MNFKLNSHPKLRDCITSMLIDTKYQLPYYGQFNLMINFIENNNIPTCGVNVSRKGMNFYYNSDFINKLPQLEVNFIDLHEIFHLIFNHPKRTVTGRYDPKLANIAQDMLINSIIWSDINKKIVQIPKGEDGRNMALFIPKEYTGLLIFEPLYEWLAEEKQKRENNNSEKGGDGDSTDDAGDAGDSEKGDGDGNGNAGDSEKGDGNGNDHGDSESDYGNYGKSGDSEVDTYSLDSIFKNLEETGGEYMDTHMEDEIPEQLRESIIDDVRDRLQSRGLYKDGIKQTLDKLIKKRKDYLKEVKRSVSNIIGSGKKQKTITRLNRRGIKGLKGNKKVISKINVLLDTSGSMGGIFDKVLSYVFRNDIEINLIQCDAEVQKVENIKNMKELQNVVISGLGGTQLMPAINYVNENLNDFNTVILTDGETDTLDFSKTKGKVLILSKNVKCPVSFEARKGFKQIFIDTTYD